MTVSLTMSLITNFETFLVWGVTRTTNDGCFLQWAILMDKKKNLPISSLSDNICTSQNFEHSPPSK